MNKYLINGGATLDGVVEIKSAKNSVLPLLAGSILTDEKVVLHNCPSIADVDNMLKILISLGCVVEREKNTIIVDGSNIISGEIPANLAKELRSSIFLLGSILSRFKYAKVAYPGGCDIGIRPIDIHLKALRELDIDVVEESGYIYCNSENMKPADIILELPSVGATENVMMATVCLRGTTTIRNCAREPEIVDLQNFLNKMGAKITGAGGSVIKIEGVEKLHAVEHTPIPDRISAGTFLIAVAMTGGKAVLNNVNYEHIYSLCSKFSKTTCKIIPFNDRIEIISRGRLDSFDLVETMYYPGFPTDLQSQVMALQTISKGTSVIVENIFESRFKQVPEFKKLGANITVSGRTAVIKGVPYLKGAEVQAFDLRGGASLVLAGLVAHDSTIVKDIHHIDRGYDCFENDLLCLGADIKRI